MPLYAAVQSTGLELYVDMTGNNPDDWHVAKIHLANKLFDTAGKCMFQ